MSCLSECQEIVLNYANIVSGTFSFLALGISVFQGFKHLRNYSNPFFQNKIMMILFMAPFYAITSFLTIYYRDTQGYFLLVRDIYEAVLIYAFFNLLSSYIAYDADQKCIDYERIYKVLANKGVRKHLWPMNYFFKDLVLVSRFRGIWFFRSCRFGILQYLALKPACTFITLIFYASHGPDWVYLIVESTAFTSVCISLYFLVLFYQILKEELAYTKPLLKFLSVKCVLFFTFWQDIALEIFKTPFLNIFGNPSHKRGELLIGVSACVLVCFEMSILSIVTIIAFSYRDFKEMQDKDSLPEKQSMFDLGKKFITKVVSHNISTAVTDLKDLASPLTVPFRNFRPNQIKKEDFISVSTEESTSNSINNDYNTKLHEDPKLITGFVPHPLQ